MSALKEAIAVTNPEVAHIIDLDAVEAWLAEHGYEVAETYGHRYRREAAAREAEKKGRREAGKARWEALPVYAGKTVKRCQGSVHPSRGAPHRCTVDKGLRVARAHDGRVVVLCHAHGVDDRPGYYNGWGGDPNPVIATVEPEYVAALEAVEKER